MSSDFRPYRRTRNEPQSPIEYFADLSFGRRVGLARHFSLKNWPAIIAVLVIFTLTAIVVLWAAWSITGLEFDRFGRLRQRNTAFSPELSLILAILLLLGAAIAFIYAGIGLNVLALRGAANKPTGVLDSLLAPLSVQPVGIFLSLLLWGVIDCGIQIALRFTMLIPFIELPVVCIYAMLITWLTLVIYFYLADCASRGRRFRVTETVSKPLRLFFGDFGLWLGTILFLIVLSLPPTVLLSYSAYAFFTDRGQMALIALGLGLALGLPAGVFAIFMNAVTYKQAKARLILRQRGFR